MYVDLWQMKNVAESYICDRVKNGFYIQFQMV
jgi:hypothetical protein